MNLISPYGKLKHSWLRGAMHVHSTNSDGDNPPQDVWKAYAALGYSFSALTDHCEQPSAADLETDTGLITIPGCEYRPRGYKDFASPEANLIGVYSPLPYGIDWTECRPVFDGQDAFVIYNHPDWNLDHWPVKRMLMLRLAHAIEVYNAAVEELPGSAECTMKWDTLLTCGYRLWAVATDDAHHPHQRGKAWVMVNAAPAAASLLAALKAGRFYSSTGVQVNSVTVEDGVIRVTSPNAKVIRFIVERGRMRKQVNGSTAEYKPADSDVYVRIELFGDALQKAWTNPVFIETPESQKRMDDHLKWFMEQP